MPEIKVVKDEYSLTVSMKHEGEATDLSNAQVNQYVGKLLAKIAEEIGNYDYEFDGIDEPSFDEGEISLTVEFFLP